MASPVGPAIPTGDAPPAGGGRDAASLAPVPPRPTDEHIASCDWCWAYWDHTLEADRWVPVRERPRVVGDGPTCPICERTAYQLRRFTRGKAPQRLEVAVCFGCGHVRALTAADPGPEPEPALLRAGAADAHATAHAPEPAAEPGAQSVPLDGGTPTAVLPGKAAATTTGQHTVPGRSAAQETAGSAPDAGSAAALPAAPRGDEDTGIQPPSRAASHAEAPRAADALDGMDAWDEAVDEEDAVVTGFRSLERWEIVTYLAWAIALLLLLNAWVWLHRAQEAGLL